MFRNFVIIAILCEREPTVEKFPGARTDVVARVAVGTDVRQLRGAKQPVDRVWLCFTRKWSGGEDGQSVGSRVPVVTLCALENPFGVGRFEPDDDRVTWNVNRHEAMVEPACIDRLRTQREASKCVLAGRAEPREVGAVCVEGCPRASAWSGCAAVDGMTLGTQPRCFGQRASSNERAKRRCVLG